jgi:hypothetical protein
VSDGAAKILRGRGEIPVPRSRFRQPLYMALNLQFEAVVEAAVVISISPSISFFRLRRQAERLLDYSDFHLNGARLTA